MVKIFGVNLKKVLSGSLATVFLVVHGALTYATETNFWASRRTASQKMRGGEVDGRGEFGQGKGQLLIAQLPKAGPLEWGGHSAPFSPKKSGTVKVPFSIGPKTGDWLGKFVMPYGTVNDVYLSPKKDAPFIVHIQDAHGIEEAQRNISSMIGLLGQEPGINLVGVEGAWGSFSLDPYRDFPDPAMTKDLAEFLLKKGLIAGPEYAGLTMPKAPTFFGAESRDLYNANVNALKTAYKDRDAAMAWVDKLKARTEKLKEIDYSETLKAFDQHFTGYQSEKVKLADYVRYLTATLTQMTHRPATPNLFGLKEALDQESALDFKQVESERTHMVEKLVKKLSAAQLEELMSKSVDYRAGRMGYSEYHTHLKQTCQNNGISFKTYPQMARYIDYVISADKIDRHALLNELDTVERTLPESLAKTPREKDLVALTYDLSLLHKLVRHEMSPTDWAHYQTRGNSFRTAPQRLATMESARVETERTIAPTISLEPFEDFCRLASERNTAFTKNIAHQMAETKTPSSILIAGGFHTEGLSALLRQKQISYVVVTPKITAIPKDNNYLDVLAHDPVPLEQLLAGDRIYLANVIALTVKRDAAEIASTSVAAAKGKVSTLKNGGYATPNEPKNKNNVFLILNLAGLKVYFVKQARTVLSTTLSWALRIFNLPTAIWESIKPLRAKLESFVLSLGSPSQPAVTPTGQRIEIKDGSGIPAPSGLMEEKRVSSLEEIFPDHLAYTSNRSNEQAKKNRADLEAQANSFRDALLTAENMAKQIGWNSVTSPTWKIDAMQNYAIVSQEVKRTENLGSIFFSYPKGWLTVHIHGSPTGFSRKDRQSLFGQEKDIAVSAQELADIILGQLGETERNNKSPILLVSCRSGGELALGPNVAQQISKILNRPVVAPSDTILHMNSLVILKDYSFKQSPDQWTPGGRWKAFSPKEADALEMQKVAQLNKIDDWFDGIDENGHQNSHNDNLVSGPHHLLTEDRLRRNLSLSKHTKGIKSVLYVGGGFDLNNVLTTFLDANHVVMVGKEYRNLAADSIRDAMMIPVPKLESDQYDLSEYKKMAQEDGFVGSVVVEKPFTQRYFVAQELLALGVDPDSVMDLESQAGISFELPGLFGAQARRVSVEFRNNTFRSGDPIRVNAGDMPFDGVYSKAIHDLAYFLEGIWSDVAPRLAPNTRMVLNQGMYYSSPLVPGFDVNRIHSDGDMTVDYGNFFVVYNLTPRSVSNEKSSTVRGAVGAVWVGPFNWAMGKYPGLKNYTNWLFALAGVLESFVIVGIFSAVPGTEAVAVAFMTWAGIWGVTQFGHRKVLVFNDATDKFEAVTSTGSVAQTATMIAFSSLFPAIIFNTLLSMETTVALAIFNTITGAAFHGGLNFKGIPVSRHDPVKRVLKAVQKSIDKLTKSFAGKLSFFGASMPAIETGLLVLLQGHLMSMGLDPSGGLFLIFSGLLFASVHTIVRLILYGKDDPRSKVNVLEFLAWTIGGGVFMGLLGMQNGWAASFGVHAVLNAVLIVVKSNNNRIEQSTPLWVKKIPLFSFLGGNFKNSDIPYVIKALSSEGDINILRIHSELMATFPDYRIVAEKQVKSGSISSIISFWTNFSNSHIGVPSENYRQDVIKGILRKISESNMTIKLDSLSVSESGAFGDIWTANINGRPVVIKAVRFEKSEMVIATMEDAILKIACLILEEKNLERLTQLKRSGAIGRVIPVLIGKGLVKTGHNVIIMEKIEGSPVNIGTKFSLTDAIHYWKALSDLHSVGFVHGDIKPANIIPLNNEAILIDFGSAKQENEGYSLGDVSISQFYAAPEIQNGALQSSDVYSMAGTMIDLLPKEVLTREDIFPYILRAIKGLPSNGLPSGQNSSFRPSAQEMLSVFHSAANNQISPLPALASDVKIMELERARIQNRKMVYESETRRIRNRLFRNSSRSGLNNLVVEFLRIIVKEEKATRWGMKFLPLEIWGIVATGWFFPIWAASLFPGLLGLDPAALGVMGMLMGLALFKLLHYALQYVQFWLGRGDKPVLSIALFAKEYFVFLPYVALPFLAQSAVLFAAGAIVAGYFHYSYDNKLLNGSDAKSLVPMTRDLNLTPGQAAGELADEVAKKLAGEAVIRLIASGPLARLPEKFRKQTSSEYGTSLFVGMPREAIETAEKNINDNNVGAVMDAGLNIGRILGRANDSKYRIPVNLVGFVSWGLKEREFALAITKGFIEENQPVLIVSDLLNESEILSMVFAPLDQKGLIKVHARANDSITMRSVEQTYGNSDIPLASTVLTRKGTEKTFTEGTRFQYMLFETLATSVNNAIQALLVALRAA